MTTEQRNELLGHPFVRAIDAYFLIHRRILSLLLPSDTAEELVNEEHAALSMWLTLLTERLTGMVASELVPLHKRIDELEKRVTNLEVMMRVGSEPDDPTGTM